MLACGNPRLFAPFYLQWRPMHWTAPTLAALGKPRAALGKRRILPAHALFQLEH
jgi:hypothetical protein